MFARPGKFVVVVALVLTTGLHWAALQTIAWTTMLAGNLCGEPLTEAVSQTFDGKHLCPLCRAIAAGKKSENKSESISPAPKMEFPPAGEVFTFVVPSPASAASLAGLFAEPFFPSPPVPPPRSFFV